MQAQSRNESVAIHFIDRRLTRFSSHNFSCLRSVTWKTTTIIELMATRNIFAQNEKVTSSRTGSPITIKIPVTTIKYNPPVSHGPNRAVVCRSV